MAQAFETRVARLPVETRKMKVKGNTAFAA